MEISWNYNILRSIWYLFICFQYQERLRNILKPSDVCITLPISIFSLCCRNTWHRCLYFSEPSRSPCASSFFIFLKNLASSTIKFNIFNDIFLVPWSTPWNCITNRNFEDANLFGQTTEYWILLDFSNPEVYLHNF